MLQGYSDRYHVGVVDLPVPVLTRDKDESSVNALVEQRLGLTGKLTLGENVNRFNPIRQRSTGVIHLHGVTGFKFVDVVENASTGTDGVTDDDCRAGVVSGRGAFAPPTDNVWVFRWVKYSVLALDWHDRRTNSKARNAKRGRFPPLPIRPRRL